MVDEAVMNEAQRVLPVSLDQVYLAYQRIPAPKGETRLFLVAYPRNSTDTLLKAIADAGLKAQSMDLAPLALARCASAPKAIIVNSWLTYVDIIVMVEGLPQVIRSLSLPTDSTAMADKLPLINEELVRTVAFYNSSYADKALETSTPLMVCGDLAEDESNWQALAATLEYPVSQLVPPLSFEADFPASQYMVNIGISLRGLVPTGADNYYSIIGLNALPRAYLPPTTSLRRILVPVVIFVALLGLGWGALIVKNAYDKTDRMQAELEQNRATVASLNADITGLNAQSAELKDDIETLGSEVAAGQNEAVLLQDSIDVQAEINLEPIEEAETAVRIQALLGNLNSGMSKANLDMGVITGLAQGTVDLVNVAYETNEANIDGTAAGENDIFTYARALRDSGQFLSVAISSVSQNETSFSFTLIITW
jgi:type IV pilus assembly protein PilM